MASSRIIVVGAGIFGLTAALELARRRHRVTVFEQGAVPNPLAASTDISKVIRMEYGPDDAYMALGEAARAGWLTWNERWLEAGSDPLYHETGVLMLSRQPMEPGGFEYESWRRLLDRGHQPERMDRQKIAVDSPLGIRGLTWTGSTTRRGDTRRAAGWWRQSRIGRGERVSRWSPEPTSLRSWRTVDASSVFEMMKGMSTLPTRSSSQRARGRPDLSAKNAVS